MALPTIWEIVGVIVKNMRCMAGRDKLRDRLRVASRIHVR